MSSEIFNKLIRLEEAVRRFTHDGQQIATNGLPVGAEPVAFARELIRQNRKNLHEESFTQGEKRFFAFQ